MDFRARRKAIDIVRSLARARRPRPRPPAMLLPDGISLSYLAAMLGFLKPMREVEAELLRVCADAQAELDSAHVLGDASRIDADKPGSGILRDAVKAAQAAFDRRLRANLAVLQRAATRAANGVDAHSRRELNRQAMAQIGIEMPWADVPKAKVQAFVKENVDLITTVPERYFGSLGKLVEKYATSGQRPETLAKLISARWGVAETDAARIARHQVAKLNGEVNVARLVDAGITRFIWRDMNDGRVRSTHAALDGESFDPENPPAEGIPGEEVNCRCYAQPDFRSMRAVA